MCDLREQDNAIHILFVCPGLDSDRNKFWEVVTSVMPDSMKTDVNNMTPKGKTVFLLSCMGQSVILEWQLVYQATCSFVEKMYTQRALAYDHIEGGIT